MTAGRLFGDQIAATQRLLSGHHRAEWNELGSGIGENDTEITLARGIDGIGRGSLLAIDNELLYVWGVMKSLSTVTVRRGVYGTAPATHDAADLVEVGPRFPRPAIRDALLDELRSWPPKLYAVEAETVTFDLASRSAAFNGDGYLHGLELLRASDDGDGTWEKVGFRVFEGTPDRTVRSQIVVRGAELRSGTYRFRYAARFALPFEPDDTDDLLDDYLLAESMLDIPPLGAAWRLLAAQEPKRSATHAQPEPRIAQEVPPQAALQAAGALKTLRDQRIAEESAVLRAAWPIASS